MFPSAPKRNTDTVTIASIPCDAPADVDQQGAETAGKVVDFDFCSVFQMVRNNFRHQQRNLVRRVKLPGFLACICGKIADQVLANEAEDVIILLSHPSECL